MRNANAGQTSVVVGGLKALGLATILFVMVLQFMPEIWKSLAEVLNLPRIFYDVMGFGGLTLIAMSVIALKSGIYGSKADKHPWFVGLNMLGGFMHLTSFGHYHNPNGITLDTIYTLVGVYGLLSFFFSSKRGEPMELANDAPSMTKFLVVVGAAQMALLGTIWVIWPSVMEFARGFNNEYFFHNAGTVGGITILTCFLGQVLGWVKSRNWMYDLFYSVGIWGYVINLTVEFNPYTVALELLIFIFLFIKLKR